MLGVMHREWSESAIDIKELFSILNSTPKYEIILIKEFKKIQMLLTLNIKKEILNFKMFVLNTLITLSLF